MSPDPGPFAVPDPPATIPGKPHVDVIQAGTLLRRVHGKFEADTFNSTPQPTRLLGGRFDSLAGTYAYTYLGYDNEGAIAETVARDLPLDGSVRLVPRVRIVARRITTVEVTRSLAVLSLHGPWLAQVGAGLWLTKCDADQYEQTRAWAAWLLEKLTSVDGFVYRCRHDEDRMALALFDDTAGGGSGRAAGALRAHADTVPIDAGEGLVEVERILGRHNAAVEPR